MSPRPPRGRRPKAWTHQQKRKLVRLYTLTTLSNAEILAVLGEEGFSPSERHVLMKLRGLYSKEYIEDLQRLRPRSEATMRSRLNVMRQSHSYRVSKFERYPRTKICPQIETSGPYSVAAKLDAGCGDVQRQGLRSGCATSGAGSRAFRNYLVPITPAFAKYLSECTLPDSQSINSALLMLDGSTASNQTILAPPENGIPEQCCPFCAQSTYQFRELTHRCHRLICGHVCHDSCLSKLFQWPSSAIPKVCPACNTALVLDPTSGIDPRELVSASKSESEYDTAVEYARPASISYISTPDAKGDILKELSSPNSSSLTQQQESDDDISSTRKRLPNRPPSYAEHVDSVVRLSFPGSFCTSSSIQSFAREASSLNRTLSSRSSWMSMSSKSTSIGSIRTSHPSQKDGPRQGILLSGRRMFYKVAGPLVKGERDFWKEIVDEGQLLPVPESRPKSLETNVFDRALNRALDRLCPGTLDPFDQSCSDCGYSIGWYHINGNYQDIDSFGNTKLHFAAAFGAPTLSVSFIRLAVDQGVDIAARNSSGQTFMHLLKTEQFLQSQGFDNSWGYIALLKCLSKLNFPFSQRDFHGRTIAHLICKDGILFPPEVKGNRAINKAIQVFEILRILDTDMDALDNHGFKAGDEILKSAKNADWDMDNYHVVERAIQEVLATCRRPGLLQISFRQTLGQSDFTPVAWIKWLQEANLVDWIDIHGDTPLIALLKNLKSESDEAALGRMVSKIVRLGVDVNMRDRKGHTAIAIAAIRGSLPCVQALIKFGASVDIINYHGRDIVSMASLRMKMAKQQGKTQCYAKILACVNLIMDIKKEHGAVDKKWEDATVFWAEQISRRNSWFWR